MGNLINSLVTVARSMETFQKGLALTSNNVTNARAPGYARQTLSMIGLPLELSQGLSGGLDSNGVISSRKDYLERGVWTQLEQHGRHAQKAGSLEAVQAAFDVTGQGGLGKALDRLFSSFLDLSVTPNSTTARDGVLRQADQLAAQFRNLSSSLSSSKTQATQEARGTVDSINDILSSLQGYNTQLRQDRRRLDDPGLDSQIHTKLDQLAELVDYSVLRGDDGSFNIYVGGQTPAVLGDHLYPLHYDVSSGSVAIQDDQGRDITATIQGGKLRGLMDADTAIQSQQTGLDRLASTVADTVNAKLAAGLDRNGAAGVTMFQYNATFGAASSIRLTGITTDQIAAAATGAPGGNTNALDLADLASAKSIDNQSFAQYYGVLAARAGSAASDARDQEHTAQLMLTQAKSLREELSAVSLDEEAARLVEFQRAYEASAQVFRTLNDLTQTTLDLLR